MTVNQKFRSVSFSTNQRLVLFSNEDRTFSWISMLRAQDLALQLRGQGLQMHPQTRSRD